jgi:23S rRNA G2445 N2-methylase RlmL
MYKANLSLRTLKFWNNLFILRQTMNKLYKRNFWLKLVKYISVIKLFVIDATVHSDFNHSEFVSQNVRMLVINLKKERDNVKISINTLI